MCSRLDFPGFVKMFVSIVIVGMTMGCMSQGSNLRPDWIEGRSQQYPIEQFLIGRGEADSRDRAEQRAYAAVARIFHANVDAQLEDHEVYSRLSREMSTTTERKITLDHLTHVTTQKVLEDVHILDAWRRRDDGQYFVLAGLDRAKAERMLVGRIAEYDRVIQENVEQGRTGMDVLTRLRGLKRAERNVQRREVANTDLQIIRTSGEGVLASYSTVKIQRELQDYVRHHIRIDVRIMGDQKAPIQQAVWDGLHQEGFIPLEHSEPESLLDPSDSNVSRNSADFLITGKTRLEDLRLFDPLFKYVRWCSDLQVIESSGHRVIGAVSRSGREGHITQAEARMRATHAMQKAVSTEISQTFARYLYDDEVMDLPASSSCLSP